VWQNGYWARLHTSPPGSLGRIPYTGTVEALRSFDGGDGTDTTPTDYTGPMWEPDTEFSARFPVGVGEIGDSGQVDVAASTSSLNVSGEDKVKLVAANLGTHDHDWIAAKVTVPDTGGTQRFPNGDSVEVPVEKTFTTENAGEADNEAHNNLPPFIGTFFIRRTSRRYYTSPYYTQLECQCSPTSTVLTGTGSPEGVVTADEGDVYSDTASSTIYIKSSGSGNTGWVLA
jgi:hypothetical protein